MSEKSIVRVCNVKTAPPGSYIYVGRQMGGKWKHLVGHELANPFKVGRNTHTLDRLNCIAKYRDWLKSHKNYKEMIDRLRKQVETGPAVLGCWCCDWDGEEYPAPICHAVILAGELNKAKGETDGKA